MDLESCCQGCVPTQWMQERILVCDIGAIVTSETDLLSKTICDLPFVYNHVGGHGTNTPQRGVCVIGDRELSTNSKIVKHTYWTSSQQTSHITLATKTTPLPDPIKNIVPCLKGLTASHFPDAPITDATYCLGVANEYRVGYRDTIAPHTDAQPWYASPPVFASIT